MTTNGPLLNSLIKAWSKPNFSPGRRNILPGDEQVMKDVATVDCRSWSKYCTGAPESPEAFHTSLMPMPWVGNLRTAKVFLLQLNPGFGAHDYFGEHRVREYRAMLQANLRQAEGHAFPFLGPEHSWHGGATYWAPRLRKIVDGLDGDWRRVAEGTAVLELVPYHSEVFKLGQPKVNRLESVRLMRAFVREELVPAAKEGKCALITLRAHARWEVSGLQKASLARSAWLGESSVNRAIEILRRSTARC